ncbi:hypothetical protein H4S06_001944 [Coemansia sp. BCRC 34490]|nr:hypothetical protein H4S06_001944 [Coemansia sp. BCRC 34490]
MIQILVRSPSVATADDFTVSMELEHTISELKAAIEKAHEASPPARHMRIICRGRILKDSSTVGEFYDNNNIDHTGLQTIHFVLNAYIAEGLESRTRKTGSNRNTAFCVAGSSRAGLDVGRSRLACVEESTINAETLDKGKAAASHASSVAGTSKSHMQSMARQTRETASRSPCITPLGNPFQYVLVDGVPYLREVREPDVGRASGSTENIVANGSGRILLKAYSDLIERQSVIERKLRRVLETRGRASRPREDGGGGTDGRSEGTRAENGQTAPREGQADNADENNNAENARAEDAPLPQVLRGFGIDAVWNIGWVLLRLLLLVVVLAHDASMERVLALVVIVAGVMALRSTWMQQVVRQINAYNNYINNGRRRGPEPDTEADGDGDGDGSGSGEGRPQHHREYSTVEKARALLIALVTSLIPSEPFHAPAMDE